MTVLAVLYAVDANAAPPPSVTVLVTVGLVLEVVTVTWAWWADRHREPVLTIAHVSGG